jgi:2-polyprenyl-3-methyl-5-hydroxy-6-metoxy-1,4-benzoquinol methylase
MDDCTPITECLACGNTDLVLTLDLQDQPLANNFQAHGGVRDTDQWYPLAINRCTNCNHLQLTDAVNPELIYTHYLYVSGTSQTNKEHMDWFAGFVREQFDRWPSEGVLDIGCNDGTQLNAFKELGFNTFGVDPAENLHPISSQKHNVVCGFWDQESVAQFNGRQFDAIVVQNAFAHNPNPLPFLTLVKESLTDKGLIFIQTSQADMVLNGEFDTIYHEHISFYNSYSMKLLAERAGLYLIDVVKPPIHGTSYIFVLSKKPLNHYRVANILAVEESLGLQQEKTYTDWSIGVNKLIARLKDQIDEYRHYGYAIVGYGAAAKGMTLINASNIRLDAVIDDNPLKQGLFCPGTAIPVVSAEYLKGFSEKESIVFVPLAWNFYTEIVRKIRNIRNNENDLFLRYFPEITTESK